MTQKTEVISIKHSRDGTVIELSTILYVVAVEIGMWSPGLENITIGIRVRSGCDINKQPGRPCA